MTSIAPPIEPLPFLASQSSTAICAATTLFLPPRSAYTMVMSLITPMTTLPSVSLPAAPAAADPAGLAEAAAEAGAADAGLAAAEDAGAADGAAPPPQAVASSMAPRLNTLSLL